MEFPKMLYRSAVKYPDYKAIETAIHDRTLETCIAASAQHEADRLADGWTADINELIGDAPKKRARKEAE